MSEFKGVNFGNLPPGCNESDPNAPWNEEDIEGPTLEKVMDCLWLALDKIYANPSYKGENKIRYWGGEIEVRSNV